MRKSQWTIGRARSRTGQVIAFTTLLGSLFYLSRLSPDWSRLVSSHDEVELDEDGLLALPMEYRRTSQDLYEEPGRCKDRYGTDYIRKFSASATDYCQNFSLSALSCFTHTAHDERTDSFCAGTPAIVDPRARAVEMDCSIRELKDEDQAKHALRLDRFPYYWYNTGPRVVFEQFVHLDSDSDETKTALRKANERMIFLVKREDTISNLWHTLMQVMSLELSLDILRTTLDVQTGRPFFTKEDERNSQVVILDFFDDGPLWDLWNLFGLPPVRLADIPDAGTSKVLIPLPGGSNPFWEGDWVDLDCGQSSLLHAFANRLLGRYSLLRASPKRNMITLTFIDRRGQRKLVNQDVHFAALKARFPEVNAQLVDLAQLSLREQFQLVRETNILVGVHGAGLTHGFFMLPDTTVVELQPPSMDHRGFHSMAKWLGLQYWREHGYEQSYEGQTNDWHGDDVFIDEEDFLNVVGTAILNTQPWQG